MDQATWDALDVGDVVECINASVDPYGEQGKVIEIKTVQGDRRVRVDFDDYGAQLFRWPDSLALVAKARGASPTYLLDEAIRRSREPKPYRERVPDELDWDKHKQFMRGL